MKRNGGELLGSNRQADEIDRQTGIENQANDNRHIRCDYRLIPLFLRNSGIFDWKIFSRNFRKQSLFGRSADRYGIERRNLDFFRFQLNKQLLAGQIWCGRRKIKKFLDLVIKSHVVVPIWSRKRNFFSKMEAKRRFLSLYVVKGKKAKHFCNKSSFSGLIWSERGKK